MDSDESSAPSSPTESITSEDSISSTITVHVHPTTGGQFEIEIPPDETAEELRRRISRRLQTPKERLNVLHKDQVLEGKALKDYNIVDGSKVTLLPAVESGFSSTVQGTQQSIIQAIESLSDPQIDDFLSGRLPLTLALRVGDHMMFVQLQLEQSQPNTQSSAPSRSHHGHHSMPYSQQSHPLSHTAPCLPHRLFTDMHNLSSIPAALAATALLPKSSAECSSKKQSSRTAVSPVIADSTIGGPAPKVPKLALNTASERQSGSQYKDEPSATTGIMYKPEQFHHHSAPASPEALSHQMLAPHFQQLANHYHEIASHVNHQANASHLHKLASACSSLGQVVAIPPVAGTPLKVPTLPDHKVKSSRKRVAPEFEAMAPGSPPKSAFFDATSAALPSPAAIIQNALLHQQRLPGFPPHPSASLLPSAYAKYQASSRAHQNRSSQSTPTTPTSPPTEIRLKHPITSTMLQTCGANGSKTPGRGSHSSQSSGSKSDRSHHHHHHGHRRSTTSGKITSSAISSHHSGISGARVARQMQRLRRLCGSHQQCVAYSNRELATEISSIVHMAKHSHHHSRSEGSSRKSHKSCRECHGRERPSGSSSSGSSRASSSQTGQNTGACIDSFTTHGPGIFSGTFSGSLHPSIQDHDGKPKRDPKTILQILTDLLNATQHYQGQLGNVGLLPQLFKDHFKGDPAGAAGESENSATQKKVKPEITIVKAEAGESKAQKASTDKITISKESASPARPAQQKQTPHRPVYKQPYPIHPNAFIPMPQSQTQSKPTPTPTSYLSSVSTIPIGTIPSAYAPRQEHVTSSSSRSRKTSPSSSQEGSKHHHHHNGRCHHYKHHHYSGGEKSCCGMSSRRQAKTQMLNSAYVKRLKQLQHENNNTRNKMKELKQMMEIQRLRRQCRRTSLKLCHRRNATDINESSALSPPAQTPSALDDGLANTTAQSALKGGKMEVQFDDIQDYEIKEVAHEPPETVTV